MVIHKEEISDEVKILILCIAARKRNHLKTLFGRCMRHLKVYIYIYIYIYVHLEANVFICWWDNMYLKKCLILQKNENWCYIKLPISTKCKDYEKSVSDQHYAQLIKNVSYLLLSYS